METYIESLGSGTDLATTGPLAGQIGLLLVWVIVVCILRGRDGDSRGSSGYSGGLLCGCGSRGDGLLDRLLRGLDLSDGLLLLRRSLLLLLLREVVAAAAVAAAEVAAEEAAAPAAAAAAVVVVVLGSVEVEREAGLVAESQEPAERTAVAAAVEPWRRRSLGFPWKPCLPRKISCHLRLQELLNNCNKIWKIEQDQ
uniref:Uncharacterized protein n=1 Tax=Coccidioides posadasii RMSCC 3488 TaxID=454284 RepID=A0A0J6FUI5_COCPO|nr:hypothetical protein CPAG_09354 [Coccidioides posadasii RMSCC 3488]